MVAAKRLAAALLALLIAAPARAGGDESRELKSDSEAAGALLTRAICTGSARVVVGLAGVKLPGDAAARKAAVAAAQQRFLSGLPELHVADVTRFAFIPMLAMEVDAAALRFLLGSRQVETVHEDAPMRELADHKALREEAKARGAVRVIVTLAVEAEADRDAISEAQTALLDRLPDGAASDVLRYRNVPQVALQTTAAGLDALLVAPGVCAVQKDATVEPLPAR